jgi:hypothetical protein
MVSDKPASPRPPATLLVVLLLVVLALVMLSLPVVTAAAVTGRGRPRPRRLESLREAWQRKVVHADATESDDPKPPLCQECAKTGRHSPILRGQGGHEQAAELAISKS